MFGVAVAAAMVAPAIAHADDTKGSLGVHYNNLDPSGSGHIDQYGIDAAVSHDFSNGWTVQGDGVSDRLHLSGASLGVGYEAVSAGVRNGQYAAYGFVGLSDLSGSSATNVGLGGQWFSNNIVLDGSVGYSDFDNTDAHVTQIGVDGAYFFNDNLSVAAEYGHTHFDTSGADNDANIYGVSGSYRLASSPVTFSLGYDRVDSDTSDGNVWRIGASWDFGTGSLHERATTGPSWSGARNLYDQTIRTVF